ncbi:uncharacterized protein [Narcine bancroftii]|uniref:uncharacterized protein isoform X1 n=1 Tax=Narcine bancroftii TaxID=1343680 RepID=UPI003831A3E5
MVGDSPSPVWLHALVAATDECILGINMLAGMALNISQGGFEFGIRTITKKLVVGQAKWDPVMVPAPMKPMCIPQYRLPGGQEEITATIDALQEEGVVRPATSPFNSPVWPVQKPDGSWRMTVDYRFLNKHAPPLASAVPDIVTLIENIATGNSGTWYAVIDLANAFFSILIAEDSQDQFAFTWKGRQYTFTHLPVSPSLSIHHYIDDVASWSLWQKQEGRRVPLGFWSRTMPEAATRYSVFEQQFLACYWALLETERMTGDADVQLRPALPIMNWVLANDANLKIGRAQQSSIVKWKWYIQSHATRGPEGVGHVHEQVAYHPRSGTQLSEEGDGGSSQYDELKAVTLPLDPHDHPLRLFTDSWALANGLVVWMPDLQKNNWMIHDRPVWGKELWQLLWDASHHREITVYYVDAHTNMATNMAQHNAVADQLATISCADTVPLAQWAHEQSGHLGEKGSAMWSRTHALSVHQDDVRMNVRTCPECRLVKFHTVPPGPHGQIKRGAHSAAVWQIDYIGPMLDCMGKYYVLVMVDTFSGLVFTFPTKTADQASTIQGLNHLIYRYDVPEEIHSDNGSHFSGKAICDWANDNGILWVHHIPYYPQAAGLVEQMNGLLKEQIRLLTSLGTQKGWCHVLQQAVDNLNHRPLKEGTPFHRLLHAPELQPIPEE